MTKYAVMVIELKYFFFKDAMHEMLHCHDKPALQVIFVAEGTFETFLKYLHQVAVSTFISDRNDSNVWRVGFFNYADSVQTFFCVQKEVTLRFSYPPPKNWKSTLIKFAEFSFANNRKG